MSTGQMLSGQMSPWQLVSVLDVPKNLHFKFHQNQFVWVVVCKVIFMSNPTKVMLGVGLISIVIKLGFWQ